MFFFVDFSEKQKCASQIMHFLSSKIRHSDSDVTFNDCRRKQNTVVKILLTQVNCLSVFICNKYFMNVYNFLQIFQFYEPVNAFCL